MTSLQDANNAPVQEQFQLVVNELRHLLQYDRVMLYQFHRDQHGEVLAESMSEYAVDTFKGLHFPSTDIPQANRGIFMVGRCSFNPGVHS